MVATSYDMHTCSRFDVDGEELPFGCGAQNVHSVLKWLYLTFIPNPHGMENTMWYCYVARQMVVHIFLQDLHQVKKC